MLNLRLLPLGAAVWMLAGAPPAWAAPPTPAADALAMIAGGHAVLAGGWRYQERISGPQGTERLSYDASLPAGKRWRLLSVNGKPPAAADQKRLEKQAAAAARNAAGPPLAGSGWLAHSRYRLVAHGGGRLVYLIQPQAGAGDTSAARGILKHLSGRLVVAASDHRPLELSLSNFESFSPRFGVTVHDMSFRATFSRLGRNGPVVVTSAVSDVKGKMFWVKGFADRTKVELSHFVPVPATAAAAATH